MRIPMTEEKNQILQFLLDLHLCGTACAFTHVHMHIHAHTHAHTQTEHI